MKSPSRETDFTSSPDLCVVSGAAVLSQEREKLSQHYGCKTGVKSIDANFSSLFQGGRVIGLGQVGGDGEGANVLSTRSLSSALLSVSDDDALSNADVAVVGVEEHETEVFILAPPSSTVISDLHALLRSRLASTITTTGIDHSMSRDDAAFKLLENVKLLQYLDLAGLVEGVLEVSQRLYEQQQQQQQQQQQPKKKRSAVVLVKGLSGALALVQRRSGTVQVAAVAASLLRSLIGLSRSFPGVLVLVDLVMGVCGGEEGGELQSAFVGEKEEVMGVLPSGVLGEVLQRGMDVVVVVHDGFGKARKVRGGGVGVKTKIVEVVKDRMGGAFGEWCTWVD